MTVRPEWQVADDRWSPLADTEVHHLRATAVGEELKIFVGHCPTVEARRPIVLYLTDANGYFGAAVDLIRNLQIARHLPDLLVVGIGYPVGQIADTIVVRTRDLTPTRDTHFAALWPGQSGMGGAGRMLSFVRDELRPWVASRFDVDNADAAYFGNSFGGLFGAYVLFEAPDTFARYILGSPSLWWDRKVIFENERRYAESAGDLPVRLYLGIGEHETQAGRLREAANLSQEEREKVAAWPLEMVDDVRAFADRLTSRGYTGLRLRAEVLPGEFHATVPVLNLSRGLRWVFDAPA